MSRGRAALGIVGLALLISTCGHGGGAGTAGTAADRATATTQSGTPKAAPHPRPKPATRPKAKPAPRSKAAEPKPKPSPRHPGHVGVSAIKPPPLLTPAQARRQLAKLSKGPRVTAISAGYRRDEFGSSWSDTDHNGCNQRDDVLLRDGLPGQVYVGTQGGCDDDVLAGSWRDPYTGRLLVFDDLKDPSQAQGVQIDHVVPLGEAWVSGARGWSKDKRKAFANDLVELLAVDGPTNASKGDEGPAAWRPRKEYQCVYARRWIGIKATWGLSVDDSERRALGELLGYC